MKLAASGKLAELAPAKHLLPDILDRSIHKKVAKEVEKTSLKSNK